MSKLELLQLQIDIRDIKMIRSDIYDLLTYERQFCREKNARYRLFERVLSACLKTADLFEMKIDHMNIIDGKADEIQGLEEKLEKMVGRRNGLENDNEGLQKGK